MEYLGHQEFHTLYPEILMPLCDGNLTSLSARVADKDKLCFAFLRQMLSALDYLAVENLIHRDVKPDNILYTSLDDDNYVFQLADFGLANHQSLAVTMCGTGYYQAPEYWPAQSKVFASQSPKVDVWSLFATLIAVHSGFEHFPPRGIGSYDVVLNALRAAAEQMPKLEPMARMHPENRASAAQLLVAHFDGNGLTTLRSKIPSIKPLAADASLPQSCPTENSIKNPQEKKHSEEKTATIAGQPALIVYPRRQRARADVSKKPPVRSFRTDGILAVPQPQKPTRTNKDRVVKHRAQPDAAILIGGIVVKTAQQQERLLIENNQGFRVP